MPIRSAESDKSGSPHREAHRQRTALHQRDSSYSIGEKKERRLSRELMGREMRMSDFSEIAMFSVPLRFSQPTLASKRPSPLITGTEPYNDGEVDAAQGQKHTPPSRSPTGGGTSVHTPSAAMNRSADSPSLPLQSPHSSQSPYSTSQRPPPRRRSKRRFYGSHHRKSHYDLCPTSALCPYCHFNDLSYPKSTSFKSVNVSVRLISIGTKSTRSITDSAQPTKKVTSVAAATPTTENDGSSDCQAADRDDIIDASPNAAHDETSLQLTMTSVYCSRRLDARPTVRWQLPTSNPPPVPTALSTQQVSAITSLRSPSSTLTPTSPSPSVTTPTIQPRRCLSLPDDPPHWVPIVGTHFVVEIRIEIHQPPSFWTVSESESGGLRGEVVYRYPLNLGSGSQGKASQQFPQTYANVSETSSDTAKVAKDSIKYTGKDTRINIQPVINPSYGLTISHPLFITFTHKKQGPLCYCPRCCCLVKELGPTSNVGCCSTGTGTRIMNICGDHENKAGEQFGAVCMACKAALAPVSQQPPAQVTQPTILTTEDQTSASEVNPLSVAIEGAHGVRRSPQVEAYQSGDMNVDREALTSTISTESIPTAPTKGDNTGTGRENGPKDFSQIQQQAVYASRSTQSTNLRHSTPPSGHSPSSPQSSPATQPRSTQPQAVHLAQVVSLDDCRRERRVTAERLSAALSQYRKCKETLASLNLLISTCQPRENVSRKPEQNNELEAITHLLTNPQPRCASLPRLLTSSSPQDGAEIKLSVGPREAPDSLSPINKDILNRLYGEAIMKLDEFGISNFRNDTHRLIELVSEVRRQVNEMETRLTNENLMLGLWQSKPLFSGEEESEVMGLTLADNTSLPRTHVSEVDPTRTPSRAPNSPEEGMGIDMMSSKLIKRQQSLIMGLTKIFPITGPPTLAVPQGVSSATGTRYASSRQGPQLYSIRGIPLDSTVLTSPDTIAAVSFTSHLAAMLSKYLFCPLRAPDGYRYTHFHIPLLSLTKSDSKVPHLTETKNTLTEATHSTSPSGSPSHRRLPGRSPLLAHYGLPHTPLPRVKKGGLKSDRSEKSEKNERGDKSERSDTRSEEFERADSEGGESERSEHKGKGDEGLPSYREGITEPAESASPSPVSPSPVSRLPLSPPLTSLEKGELPTAYYPSFNLSSIDRAMSERGYKDLVRMVQQLCWQRGAWMTGEMEGWPVLQVLSHLVQHELHRGRERESSEVV